MFRRFFAPLAEKVPISAPETDLLRPFPTALRGSPLPRATLVVPFCRSAVVAQRGSPMPRQTLADTANITLCPSRVNIHLLEKVRQPTANFFAPATR